MNENKASTYQDDPNYQRFSKDLRSKLSNEQINQLWEIFQDPKISTDLLQIQKKLDELAQDIITSSVKSFENTSVLFERIVKLGERLKYAKLHVLDRDKLLRMEKEAEEEKKKLESDLQFGV